MKHYDSIPSIKEDKSLIGENILAFNKLDGQNFCAKYSPKVNEFTMFGSRTQNVDETSEQFGDAVKYFKANLETPLKEVIKNNKGKNQIFHGIEEITFFFEWYGEHSFAGFHQPNETLKLALIDVFLKKKGYIEPKIFVDIFYDNPSIETPLLVYSGKLTNDFIKTIQENDYTEANGNLNEVKEGVVCKRSTLLKGQRLPMVKIKTKWWLDKLHSTFSEEQCKKLE